VLELPPLSLYIHFPWCARKCPYCDFNSHALHGAIPEENYLHALRDDLEEEAAQAKGRAIHSLFIGGGTPSLISSAVIAMLLASCRDVLPFGPETEITMEANPGSSEQEKFTALHAVGINRLSIGVQSFSSSQLLALGRVHDSAEAKSAILSAQQAGFRRINVDLMFGLPTQSVEGALNDLHQALDLGVRHLSWYQLTLEKNTQFYRHPPELPGEELIEEMQARGKELLALYGLHQYEVSAFAKPGEECRHNRNYWALGDYLAIGAGAHGKLTDPENKRIRRYQKTRQPQDYLARSGSRTASEEWIAGDELLFEGLMNGLRLVSGVPLTTLLRRTGASQSQLERLCRKAVEFGLLELSPNVQATEKGFRYLDSLLEMIAEASG
jgi:putative oxygen-independent coproporphyrinogen III oxidase